MKTFTHWSIAGATNRAVPQRDGSVATDYPSGSVGMPERMIPSNVFGGLYSGQASM